MVLALAGLEMCALLFDGGCMPCSMEMYALLLLDGLLDRNVCVVMGMCVCVCVDGEWGWGVM